MKTRPLIFNIAMILMLIEPLLKVISLKFKTGLPLLTVIDNLSNMTGLQNIFEFWFLFPLGALALIKIRKWSYVLFIGVQLYSLVTIILYKSYNWPYISETPLLTTLLVLGLNLFAIIYFLTPDIRRPFFDKKERWWEPKTRYKTHLKTVINFGMENAVYDAEILNISQSGVFLTSSKNLNNMDTVTLDFKMLNETFSFKAKVISHHTTDGVAGYGLQLIIKNIGDYLSIRKVIAHHKLNAGF